MKTSYTHLTAVLAALCYGVLSVAAQGTPRDLPVHFAPTQADYDACVVLPDVDLPNWDFGSNYIRYEGDYMDVFRCYYDYNQPQDDWLILPQLATAAGGNFRITYDAYPTAKVSYSIVWGTAPNPESMTNVIVSEEDFDKSLEKYQGSHEFKVPAGSDIYVGFHVTTPLGAGYFDICNIDIASAATAFPKAPGLAVTMDGTAGTATVTLPTLTVGEEPIPSAALTGSLVIDGRSDLTFDISGAPGETVTKTFTVATGSHTAECQVAYTADGTEWPSAKATATFTATLPSDFALDLPLSFTPSAENFDWLTVLDVNKDEATWAFWEPDQLRINYHSKNAANDWAILPAVNVTEAGTYKLTMKAAAHSKNCPESVELCLGTAADPASMTKTVIRLESLADEHGDDGSLPVFGGEVTIDAPGKYFLGIHGFSAPDQLYLYISTIIMDKVEEAGKYDNIDPEVYATLPGDMFDIDVELACTEGVMFTFKPKDKLMLYANIMVDERYVTEDKLGELDFADQIVKVSNEMLGYVGNLEAALQAEFFYIGDVSASGFGGKDVGLRAFFAVMGLTYDEAANTVTAATKISTSDVFEIVNGELPKEEPWVEFGELEYTTAKGKNVVRVNVIPNAAAGDYVYGKGFAENYRDTNSDTEIIAYLTNVDNMMETWAMNNRIDVPLEPGERSLVCVTAMYKDSGKVSSKLNWILVEAPAEPGQPVTVLSSYSGITEAAVAPVGLPDGYYTVDGRRISDTKPAPGVYIRVDCGRAAKVIVR